MGLLDDAIRQHLELKKRKGDDLEEVWQAERDVLGETDGPLEEVEGAEAPQDRLSVGAAEHETAPQQDTPVVSGPDKTSTPAQSDSFQEGDDRLGETVEWQLPAELTAAQDAASATAHKPQQGSESLEPIDLTPAAKAEVTDSDPQTDSPVAPTFDPESLSVPLESAELGEVQRPNDDLLEGTPDFLEETPEYDRLWFEQKPPRNFDFG